MSKEEDTMSELLGIIAPLKKFLSDTDENIHASFGNEKKTILPLEKGRIYNIPDFQREIRWNNDNVAMLVEDIKSGSKFLGNIILTKHSKMEYSIIDGQQRITVLTMILSCIKKLHQSEIEIINPCKLEIDSFSKFSLLLEKGFPQEEEFQMEIMESDKLKQSSKYFALWKYIFELDDIKNKRKAMKIIENLGASNFNIIVNESEDVSEGIRYFIDVNLKGKQLDIEDIFKSYLFRNDSSEDIRVEWYNLKKYSAEIESSKMDYALLKLLEHYFYCDLYLDDKFRGMEFGTDFLLKKPHKLSDTEVCREKTHIIELISSNQYMKKALQEINEIANIMLKIVNSDSVTIEFEKLVHYTDNKGNVNKLDNVELKIIHNIISKILKDSKIPPKALVMKYIHEVLIKSKDKTKEDIRNIYGVYMFTVLFTIFENKKSTDVLINILKGNDSDWYKELIEQIHGYFVIDGITDARLLAQYKLSQNEEEEDYRFRCKSLATIYNYFCLKDNCVSIRKGCINDMFKFITDDNTFSLEHFVISESKEHKIKLCDGQDEYILDDKLYKRYVNNFFNYIFIKKELNSRLMNYWLPKKIEMLQDESIECNYSKMIINNLNKLNTEFLNQKKTEDYKDNFDLFFARDFKDQYIEYTKNTLNEIIENVKKV